MWDFKKILNTIESQTTNRTLILYILFAFLFSLTIRVFFYYQISNNSNYFYENNIIALWNADSGLYGFYAKQLLDGVVYPLTSEYMAGYLIYWIVKLTGFNIASVIFFIPAFCSSLIVIPIILIAKNYNITKIGVYAALFGSVAGSYYHRTHLGFYDTDMLNVFFPLLLIYFLIKQVDSKNILYSISTSITLIAFYFWYHSSQAIIASLIITYIIYVILFELKHNYSYQSLLVLFITITPMENSYKIPLLFIVPSLFAIINRYTNINYKYYLALSIILIATASFSAKGLSNNISKYYDRANAYVNKSEIIDLGKIKLKATLSNVAEAQSVDFTELSRLILGNIPLFIIALLGYMALLIRYRSMLLSAPLVFLAFLSMFAGLRFSIYGVMLFSFGLAFGIYLINTILQKKGVFSSKISTATTHIALILVIFFTLNNILSYNKKTSPSIFSSTEDLNALKNLENHSKRGDFILTWWDYGWSLWYYTKMQTLIDNGKHHEDNYIVSKILLSTNQTFVRNASVFFSEKYIEGRAKGFPSVMKYFNAKHKMEYLEQFNNKEFVPPKKKRELYILLHQRMIPSLISIELFSNLDPKTGKSKPSNISNIAYLNKRYNSSQNILYTTTSVKINKSRGLIALLEGTAKMKRLSIIENSVVKFEQDYQSANNGYILVNDNRVFLIKPKIYDSFLIQALLFDNYNRNYFTKIARTKNFLILKVNDK